MRAQTLKLLLALLAFIAPATAAAKEGTVVELYLAPGAGVDFNAASDRIRSGIQDFIDELPANVRSAFQPFNIVVVRRPATFSGTAAMRHRWQTSPATVAVLSANVDAEGNTAFATVGSVYIGSSDIQSRVAPNGGDTYLRVTGSAGSSAHRLEMYQLIIGYALLVRAWQNNAGREVVDPLAGVLTRRANEMVGGRWTSSDCRERIVQAIHSIQNKVRAGVRIATSGRIVSPESSVTCRRS